MPSKSQTNEPTAEPRPVPFVNPTTVSYPFSFFHFLSASNSTGASGIFSKGIESYSDAYLLKS